MAARARILVVDDEPDILLAMRAYFEESLGIDVVVAESGKAALELAAKGPPPDLVVSDFRMPGMDGLELLRKLRRLIPDVPRIMLTAYPDLHLAIRAVNEAAVHQFLTKPIHPEQLLGLVGTTLDESRRARAARAALDRAAGLAQGKP